MRTWNLLIIIIAVFVFACFFWPGVYHYDQRQLAGGGTELIRINRITGNVQSYEDGRWVSY